MGKTTYELSDLWVVGYGVSKGVAWWEGFADHMTSDSWGSEEGGFGGRKGVG